MGHNYIVGLNVEVFYWLSGSMSASIQLNNFIDIFFSLDFLACNILTWQKRKGKIILFTKLGVMEGWLV